MLRGRSGWLARPWFFAAVALLALNDHVFKAAWPGWVTGKLSDFAGLVVVATLVSVVLGHRLGTVIAGLGFVGLKTVPGVAELVAPLLGGVTLRDPSDLIALLVLPGLWSVLARERADQSSRNRRGWQVMGLVAGLLATTATSQAPTDVVQSIGWLDGAFYATVPLSDGFGHKHLKSTDGGRTWIAVEKLPRDIQRVSIEDGSLSACSADALCYRARREQVSANFVFRLMVDRREPGGDWLRDVVLPDPHAHGLAVDAVTGQVIVQSGQRTIRYRTDAGDWPEVDLVSKAQPPQWQVDLVRSWGSRGTTGVLLVLLSAVCWLVFPTARMGVAAQVLNLLAAGASTVTMSALGRTSLHLTWIAAVLVLAVPMVIIRRVNRRRRSHDPSGSARDRLP